MILRNSQHFHNIVNLEELCRTEYRLEIKNWLEKRLELLLERSRFKKKFMHDQSFRMFHSLRTKAFQLIAAKGPNKGKVAQA